MEPASYQETQTGVWTLVVLFVVGALELKFGLNLQPEWFTLALVLGLGLLAVIFSSMTIRVTPEAVEWWLGLPLMKRRVPIADIASVSAGQVGWLTGLGIRTDGRNVTWIVTGRSVVILTLANGRHTRLGSNEPERVVEAIRAALGEAK
ncbi:MAG TPA: hypothetical protein VIK27_01470 [Candidatus Aquilonibacter sp.]